MGEIIPRHIFISLLVFSILVMGGITILGSFKDTYDITDEGKFRDVNSSFNRMQEITNNSNKLQASIENSGKENPGLLGMLNTLVIGGWNGLTGLFKSLDILRELLEEIPEIFPQIPIWIPASVFAIITVILVFAIWSAIFQKEV